VPVKRRATLEQKRVDEIAASILDKGLLTPILVRADGARFVLVEGLHHLGAPKALGEETIVGFRAEALAHDLIRYGDLQQACSHLLCATAPAGSRRSSYFLRKLSRAPLADLELAVNWLWSASANALAPCRAFAVALTASLTIRTIG
jgi:sulfiredoxin